PAGARHVGLMRNAECGNSVNGRGGIRTHGTLSRTHTFQACALNPSATRPTHNNPDSAAAFSQHAADSGLFLNGQGEIRTHDTLSGMPVFETGAFNHSATCPTFQ